MVELYVSRISPSSFSFEPVKGGCLEELGDGNAWITDEQFVGWVVASVEGVDAGEGLFATC